MMLMFLSSTNPVFSSPRAIAASAPGYESNVILLGSPITRRGSCARTVATHAVVPPRNVMKSRRLVCRERSKLKGDGGRFTRSPPSRLEARRRLGSQTANELGAPVVSSKPEQLPGHEPASARKGYEDGDAFVLRN